MLTWVVLGSTLTLMISLSETTYHYRKRVHEAERKYHTVKEGKFTIEAGDSSSSKSVDCNHRQNAAVEYTILRKIHHSASLAVTPAYAPDLDLLDDGILLDREDENRIGPSSEQYNEHGVQIENNCCD